MTFIEVDNIHSNVVHVLLRVLYIRCLEIASVSWKLLVGNCEQQVAEKVYFLYFLVTSRKKHQRL